MSLRSKKLGAFGERIAADYLRQRGYEIRVINFRCPRGEIDIVAERPDVLVFVEVKTRQGRRFGTAVEALTAAKLRRMATAAQVYMQQSGLEERACRIDLLAIDLAPDGRVIEVSLIESVVEM